MTDKDTRPISKDRLVEARTNGAGSVDPRSQMTTDHEKTAEDRVQAKREASLHAMLTAKRQEVLYQVKETLGRSLTDDQQRRLESAKDVGDQAMMDLERELGISLLEMQNRKRQMIDEALVRLTDGSYGVCADCGAEISERRLAAVPFATLCIACQSRQELMDKIERGEERD